jgi:hypothetical protein
MRMLRRDTNNAGNSTLYLRLWSFSFAPIVHRASDGPTFMKRLRGDEFLSNDTHASAIHAEIIVPRSSGRATIHLVIALLDPKLEVIHETEEPRAHFHMDVRGRIHHHRGARDVGDYPEEPPLGFLSGTCERYGIDFLR